MMNTSHSAAYFLAVFLFAGVETHVLEQHHFAVPDIEAVDIIRHQRYVSPQCLAQVLRHRLQAVLGRELAFHRTTQVRAHHHRGALFQCQFDGGQRGQDSRVTGDRAVLDRDVQVLADQHAFALQVEVAHLQHGHCYQSLEPVVEWEVMTSR
jgi:hypothetical protein